MSAHTGSSVEALCIVACAVWVVAVVLFCTHGIEALARWAERRDERRESVRTVRALGAALLGFDAARRSGGGPTT